MTTSPAPQTTADTNAASRRGTGAPFDRVVLIFNPQSTGDAPRLAEELHADLATRLPELPLVMRPTEHAGHARDLAREAAQTGRPLVVGFGPRHPSRSSSETAGSGPGSGALEAS